MIRRFIIAVLLLQLAGCSWVYARLTYDFQPLPGNSQILYEPGAQDMAKLVDENLAVSLRRVESQQYVPFQNSNAIRVIVFNDRTRYADFSHASVLTRGSSTTDEVYLSEKLRERLDTLPVILIHELSHVHIRQYTGTYRYVTDLPSWFLEGLAVSVSSGAGAENVTAEQARAAIRKGHRFEPEDSGRLSGPRNAHSYGMRPHMYYRQAGLFVAYLRNTSPTGFEAALTDVLNGDSFQAVWQKHYGRDISELWQSYEKDIGA